MDTTFIRDRITELRLQKGVSEYKMSMDLGHSKSYIQSISSGKSLPSLSEFLYICEYFDISPKTFLIQKHIIRSLWKKQKFKSNARETWCVILVSAS